jgi:hypothetical protein
MREGRMTKAERCRELGGVWDEERGMCEGYIEKWFNEFSGILGVSGVKLSFVPEEAEKVIRSPCALTGEGIVFLPETWKKHPPEKKEEELYMKAHIWHELLHIKIDRSDLPEKLKEAMDWVSEYRLFEFPTFEEVKQEAIRRLKEIG